MRSRVKRELRLRRRGRNARCDFVLWGADNAREYQEIYKLINGAVKEAMYSSVPAKQS
jgi:hypothetical protein